MKKRKNIKFAEGLSFKKLFFIFVIGCIIGVVWEESYLYVKRLILDYDDTSWRLHRGLIYGPFNPVYGIGAVFIVYVTEKLKKNLFITFIVSALIGGIVEYGIHFFQDIVYGMTSWDYEEYFLNIGGRTNLLYMIFFGILGVLFVKLIYPTISNLIEKIPIKIGNIIFYVLLVFFIINAFLSYTAVLRMVERKDNLPPSNKLEEIYDEIYPDEFLKKIYVNLK